jgi:hypothetical protein
MKDLKKQITIRFIHETDILFKPWIEYLNSIYRVFGKKLIKISRVEKFLIYKPIVLFSLKNLFFSGYLPQTKENFY